MPVSEAARGFIRTYTDPETGRDLIALQELRALVPEVAGGQVLEGVLRAGAEVLLIAVGEDNGSVRERVMVRLPAGWQPVARALSN